MFIMNNGHDIQHNDIQHNDIQHNDIQHNDIQHNNKWNATLNTMTLCITRQYNDTPTHYWSKNCNTQFKTPLLSYSANYKRNILYTNLGQGHYIALKYRQIYKNELCFFFVFIKNRNHIQSFSTLRTVANDIKHRWLFVCLFICSHVHSYTSLSIHIYTFVSFFEYTLLILKL
jgi:hypothetical protein